MPRTLQQQLDDVDSAIAAIEKGAQTVTTPLGVIYTRGNLEALYARQRELKGELALANVSGPAAGIQEIALGRVF